MAALKSALYRILESPFPGDRLARALDKFLIVLILANVAAVLLESVDDIEKAYGYYFNAFELFSVTVFTAEYIARIWIATEDPRGQVHGAIHDRLRYLTSFHGIVDLLAVLPFYLSLVIVIDPRVLRALRLFRLLKLTRYSSALAVFGQVLHSQRHSLGATVILMLVLLVFAATTIYLFESDAQPKVFGSIPNAMWWTIVTITTLGYGDVVPVTSIGKAFGGFLAVMGILMLALPTGILANGFAEEMRRRNFVVTWRLVAHVPLFTHLDAVAISDIAALLKPKLVPPAYTIVSRGEQADSMYFIASGEVEVEVRPTPHRLKAGDFFGEIALLKECERTATVTAVTECQLLILDAKDFRRLLRDHPPIADAVTKVMTERLAELERGRTTA
jgi:voltage-gated potassium channel